MMAHIYSPSKSAMQAGKRASGFWLLRCQAQSPQLIEPLMGYTSTKDPQAGLEIRFNSREEAVAFAEKNGIPYQISAPHAAGEQKLSYADNFRADRKIPWTH